MKKIKVFLAGVWAEIKAFPIEFSGMFVSLWRWAFAPIEKTRLKEHVFWGYFGWHLATSFAKRRTKKWPAKYDQNGAINGVFPYTKNSLVVLNKIEIKQLKKQSPAFSPMAAVNPRKFLKRVSYYKTEQK